MRHSTRWTTTAVFMALLAWASSTPGSTILVPNDAETIQLGILASETGDTVLVLPGTYLENIDFLGKEIVVLSSEGPDLTIIDGGSGGATVTFAGGEPRTTLLQGFTITGYGYHGHFRGIEIHASSPTIRSNRIVENRVDETTPSHGAGIYAVEASSPAILENEIVSNRADGPAMDPVSPVYGGGIYLQSTLELPFPAEITRNVIDSNAARGGNARGGGIYVDVAVATDCRVWGNQITNNTASANGGTSAKGGGVYANCIVDSNRVESCTATMSSPFASSYTAGGGIYLSDPEAHAEGNWVNDCAAESIGSDSHTTSVSGAGGGIYAKGSLAGNVIARNGVYLHRGNLLPTNMVGEGGGVYCEGASFTGNTVFENVLSRSGSAATIVMLGGGVRFLYATSTSNNIVVGNSITPTGGEGGGIYEGVDFTCNDVWGNAPDDYGGVTDPTGSDGNISEDPVFCDPTLPDLSLAESSPCAPDHSGGCGLIGALDVGCTTPADAPTDPSIEGGIVGIGAAFPNPSASAFWISRRDLAAAPLSVEVYDCSGRLVRSIGRDRLGQADPLALWDGRDGRGIEVRSGTYYCRIRTGMNAVVEKLILVR